MYLFAIFREGYWPEPINASSFISKELQKKCQFPNSDTSYRLHQYLFQALCSRSKVYLSMHQNHNDNNFLISHFIHMCPRVENAPSIENYYETEKEYQLRTSSQNHVFFETNKQTKASHDLSKILEKKDEKAFSPTRLEYYQNCPKAYYFKHVLKLENQSSIEPGLNPKDWGDIIHKLFQTAYSETQFPSRITLEKIGKKLIHEAKITKFAKHLATNKLLGTQNQTGLIDWFFDDLQEIDSTLQVIHTEQFFGNNQDCSIKKLEKPIQLHGQIDSILISQDGEKFVVSDYKTGSTIPTGKSLFNISKSPIAYLSLCITQKIP